MWLLPIEQTEEQKAAELAAFMARHDEAAKRSQQKADWLKASTCPHCGQHPPIPPWFY